MAALLTAAGWLLARLPGEVLADQRGAFVSAVAEARPLIIEISPPVGVRIKAGDRTLVELPTPAAVHHGRRDATTAGRLAQTDPAS